MWHTTAFVRHRGSSQLPHSLAFRHHGFDTLATLMQSMRVTYDRICAAQRWHLAVFASRSCYTALLRLDTAALIFLVTLYLSCFS